MEGHWLNGGTIPPDILTTQQRPDLIILDRQTKSITILELTCSFEKNIEAAHIRKAIKYNDLKIDLESRGWSSNIVPFEIGSRGHVTKRNKLSIYKTMKNWNIKVNQNTLIKNLSKISLLCSFTLFQAHSQPSWQNPPYLHP